MTFKKFFAFFKKKETMEVWKIRLIVKTFDSMYKEFRADKSGSGFKIEFAADITLKCWKQIKTLLKNEGRKPIATIEFINRKYSKSKSIAMVKKNDAHMCITNTLALIYAINEELTDGIQSVQTTHTLSDYVFLKLIFSSCYSIISVFDSWISKELLETYNPIIDIVQKCLDKNFVSLENIKDLSEHYNSIIRLLTNKVVNLHSSEARMAFDPDTKHMERVNAIKDKSTNEVPIPKNPI